MKYYCFTLEVDYGHYKTKYFLVDEGKSMAHILHFHRESEKKQCHILFAEEISKKVYDELNDKEWFA